MVRRNRKGYRYGELESVKFEASREGYYEGLIQIKSLGYEVEDFIHHFPCFVGHLTLSRFLCLYELYKRSLGIAGHIADVGVFKGASLLFFSKLVQLFESSSLTQVHGFDWFKGCEPGEGEELLVRGESSQYSRHTNPHRKEQSCSS
jgi:hypothetical protein